MIKKFLAVCIISVINLSALAQSGSVKGVVINARTSEILPYATVFINYTTLWTTANAAGEFVLKNIPFGEHELAATFVGHQPFQIKINLMDTITKSVTLKLESYPLREVEVRSKKDKEWNRQYERFKKLFLGNSVHVESCKILNPWVLDFKTDENRFFVAASQDVLEIENHNLGYRLHYQLKNLSYGSAEFTISGTVRFEVMESSDSAMNSTWTKNRQQVYVGSVRHLNTSILNGTVHDDGFQLYRDDTGVNHIVRLAQLEANVGKGISHYPADNLVVEELSPNNFKVALPKRLEVHYLNRVEYPKIYRNVNHPVSWLEVHGGYLLINNKGIVLNPSKLVLSGEMSDARVAELLPFDFKPSNRTPLRHEPAVAARTNAVNAVSMLLEKAYLHTDKSYYYPREVLWFRGYMNYAEPLLSDSLSKVIYVELIDSNTNIVSRKILPILQGVIIGSLTISPTLAGGDYVLRAYTRWMLNFDAALIFSKPIRILEYNQIARPKPDYLERESTGGLIILLKKDSFQVREKITVSLGVMDDLELFKPANFSVAVTDLKQAVPAENEGSILTGIGMSHIALPESVSSDKKFPVQRGIDFKGQLFTRKGKPVQGTLTVGQEYSSQDFTITTEQDGMFSFSDLQLYDSARLHVLPVTNKGLLGKVVMDSSSQVPDSHMVAPLRIEILKSENPSRNNSWEILTNTTILKELVVEDTRLENSGRTVSITAADYTVSGKSLRDSRTNDLMMSLQSKVPGLRIIGGKIVLGSPGTFGDPEVLVLIDGLEVNGSTPTGNDIQGGALDRVSSLSAQEIENIEVFKYSSAGAYGSRGANGVISITTRKPGDGETSELAAGKGKSQEIRIPRFSAINKFFAPDYGSINESETRPDYRSTIYWNPYVPTNEKNVSTVQFYAADLPTKYRIVVEGVTRDGHFVRCEKLISIWGNVD